MSRTSAFAIALLAFLAAPMGAGAATVGQPFIVIDGPDVSGSVINLFTQDGPSNAYATTLSGTITAAFGATDLVGKAFSFFFDDFLPGLGADLSIGGTAAAFVEVTGGFGPTDFDLYVEPPFEEVPTGPGSTEYRYLGDFAGIPSRPGRPTGNLPGFDMVLDVELFAPLPMKNFQAIDGDGNILFETDYVEGPLSIRRITLGTVGGDPVPMPPVPLPAGLPLLLLGLGGIGVARWQRGV